MAGEFLEELAAARWLLSGNSIFVRRGEADVEALDAGLEVLRSGGILGISPEGKISKTGSLMPGQTGAAYLATRASVPLVPIGLWGHEQLLGSWLRFRRPEVHINIGEPLTLPSGSASAAELQQYTMQIMHAIAALLPTGYRGIYQ
jgi:1-acyl-sn-glycerol-3-phosphate acyltransferase